MEYLKLDHPDVINVLFNPRHHLTASSVSDIVELGIEMEKGVFIFSRFHLAEKDAVNILFFHGNGEIASDYDDIGQLFIQHGMSLLAVDYRGYGSSGGSPSASSMMADSHSLFRYVKQWLTEQGRIGPLLIMGRSLGSASALELAVNFQDDIKGLILESAFGPTIPLLETLGLACHDLGITEMDGFNNVEKISRVQLPTLILHAQNDHLLPLVTAEILHSHCGARVKELKIVPGADHNNIIDIAGSLYYQELKRFCDKIQKKRVLRNRR